MHNCNENANNNCNTLDNPCVDDVEPGVNVNLLGINVCGLVNKLKDTVFVEEILKYSIVCLTETKSDIIDEVTIEKFAYENKYRSFSKSRKM